MSKEDIQKMEDKWLLLEIYNRKQNLLIYGVHETEQSEDTYITVRKAFKGQVHSKNNLLSIKAEKSDKPIKKSLSKIG